MLKKMSVVLGLAVTVVAVACSGGGGQSQECKDYLACAEKTKTGSQSLTDTYGDKGTCWTTGGATADSCTAACKSALSSLKTGYPDAGC
jgi:hypothetical protein